MIAACPGCGANISTREPVVYQFMDEAKNALAVKCTRCDCIFTVQVAILKPGRPVPQTNKP